MTVRVDPVRLRVTGRLGGRAAAVAGGVVWSYCCPRGDNFMGFGRVDARTLRPRPPLVVTDASGRRQPVGSLALGPEAVWTVAFGHQRLWRVPLGGGPARPVFRVGGFLYGLAADAGLVWVLSGSGDPDRQRDRPAAATGPAPRRGHRHHPAAGAGGWRLPGPARARPWRWRRLGGRSALRRIARWRHSAAGGSRLGAGGWVAARPARVRPGGAGGGAAWGVGWGTEAPALLHVIAA